MDVYRKMELRTFSSESSFTFWILWMLIMVIPGMGVGGSIRDEQRLMTARAPYIEPPHQLNLTVLMGQTAFLRCPVKYLGDKTVSWMRRRDLHILTSGNHIFTSDSRVSLLRDGGSWTLRLESVGRKDDSPYECQINTEPKMRRAVFLTVIGSQNDEWVPPLGAQVDYRLRPEAASAAGREARILGPSTLGIKVGSVLELTCLVSQGDPPPNITWYHGESRLFGGAISRRSSAEGGGGLEIQTFRGGPFTTISKLKLWSVQARDGGKYSCGGDGIEFPASVLLEPLLAQDAAEAHYDFDDVRGEESSTGRLGNVSNSGSRSNGLIQILKPATTTTTTILLVFTFSRL